MNGPEFLRFCKPVVATLREMGGEGRSNEVTDTVIERQQIPEAEQQATLKDGVTSRVRNQVAWARFYLVKAGLIDSSKRGVWKLTPSGRETDLTESAVLQLFRDVQRQKKPSTKDVSAAGVASDDVDEFEEPADYRTQLIEMLRSLPPAGFEHFCKQLLQQTGFERVTVTGRTNDGGIDGHGILMLNAFVSYKAVFQCKRYVGSVGASQVRDFRGAMLGRADKGILITTGTFTTEARKEAYRDGVPPIELVDGEKVVELCADHEFGLRPKRDFDVDTEFFTAFMDQQSTTDAL
jgi:restriction system protein